MPYYPHVVKSMAGIQPAIVDRVHYVENTGAPLGQQLRLYTDIRLVGTASSRSRFDRVRYVGQLTANTYDDDSHAGATVTAYGGFYDNLRDFLTSAEGGSLGSGTAPTLIEAIERLLKGKNVLVQVLGGRLVVL